MQTAFAPSLAGRVGMKRRGKGGEKVVMLSTRDGCDVMQMIG